MPQIDLNPDRHKFDMWRNRVDRPSGLHSHPPRLMTSDARSDLLFVYHLTFVYDEMIGLALHNDCCRLQFTILQSRA